MQKLLFTLIRFSLAFILVAMFGTVLLAQNPDNPFEQGTNAEKIFNFYTVIYGAAITILTRLQAAFFPNAGAVPKTVVRYILIAAVVAGIFIALGIANGWSIAVGFFGAALTYDTILKPLNIVKTPTPKVKAAA